MPTLYHCLSARSFRVLWTLEELELDYDLKVLPFPPRQLAREYLEVNPLGTIPAYFEDGLRMTESVAICQFLVDRHAPTPLAVKVDDPAYGAYLNWLYFGEATLTFPQTLVLRYTRLEPPERRNPQAAQDYQRWFLGRLRGLDSVVDHGYLCAGRFTIADISVAYALLLASHLGLGEHFSPAVTAYFEGLKARPAFLRALAAERKGAVAAGLDPDIAKVYLPRDA